MNITIDWQLPLQLTKHKKIILDPKDIPEWVDASPGVYMFTRKFGNTYVPFYIGESLSLQQRLKDHLKTVKIVDVLRSQSGDSEIKKGTRHQLWISARKLSKGWCEKTPRHRTTIFDSKSY